MHLGREGDEDRAPAASCHGEDAVTQSRSDRRCGPEYGCTTYASTSFGPREGSRIAIEFSSHARLIWLAREVPDARPSATAESA